MIARIVMMNHKDPKVSVLEPSLAERSPWGEDAASDLSLQVLMAVSAYGT